GVSLRFDTRCVVLALLVVHSFISSLLSPYANYALSHWQQFAIGALVTYVIFILTTDLSRYRGVALVIALSLAFENAKQGWVQMLLNPGGKNFNYNPFLGDENGVAIGMFMLVPVLIALARTASNRWEQRLHWFLAGGVLLRGIATYSRGGFLACVALGGVYFV